MSVQKKSLIGDRTAVHKAIIASKPAAGPVGQPKTLQAEALKGTGHSALKGTGHSALKGSGHSALKGSGHAAFKVIG